MTAAMRTLGFTVTDDASQADLIIGAAALDATVVEPACGSPLASLPNCILTPHAGAATYEAGYNMGMLAAQNVLDVLSGRECRFLV